jgi:ABC-2 type transport system permease protein
MKLIMLFFSGSVVPLNLLPKSLISVNDFLPFKNMAWIPISIMTGKIEPSLEILFPGLAWILILILLAHLIFNQALKYYEGLGA